MLRVGIENGRLSLNAELLARDAFDVRLPVLMRRATSRKEQRFEPIEELAATLDRHAAAAVAV